MSLSVDAVDIKKRIEGCKTPQEVESIRLDYLGKKGFSFILSFKLKVESDFMALILIFSKSTNWLHGPFSSKKFFIFGIAKTGKLSVPITVFGIHYY